METRPVIIIGGGIWGCLLAYRLKTHRPEIIFKLYEPTHDVGEGLSWTFHQGDLNPEAARWIRPFVSKSWGSYQVEFPKFTKIISNKFNLIHSSQFEKVLKEILPENIYHNDEIDIEDALVEGRFVIDTRNFGHFKPRGFQKSLGFNFKLKIPHELRSPITMDTKIPQLDGFRYLQFFPLSESELLVRDVRHSQNPSFHTGSIKQDMIDEMIKRGWEIESVDDGQEFSLNGVPDTEVSVRSEGRVINLSGLFHDTTGDALPDAVRLIDRMVQTSFRLGELKEVVKNYRMEREANRKYFRYLNRSQNNQQIFQCLYQMPSLLRSKFYAGEIEFLDLCWALLGLKPQLLNIAKLPKLLTAIRG